MGMLLCAGKLAGFQRVCYIVFSVFPMVSKGIKGLGSELLGGDSHVFHWDETQVRILRVWKHLASAIVDAVQVCGCVVTLQWCKCCICRHPSELVGRTEQRTGFVAALKRCKKSFASLKIAYVLIHLYENKQAYGVLVSNK